MEKKGDMFFTKDDGVDAFHLRNEAAHKPLVFKLAPLCRLDRLIVRLHGLLQFEPQVLPVHPKGFDLALPLLLRFPQLFYLFDQASIFKAALLGDVCRRLEVSYEERVGRGLRPSLSVSHQVQSGGRRQIVVSSSRRGKWSHLTRQSHWQVSETKEKAQATRPEPAGEQPINTARNDQIDEF